MNQLIVKGPITALKGNFYCTRDISPTSDPVDVQTLEVMLREAQPTRVLIVMDGYDDYTAQEEATLEIHLHSDVCPSAALFAFAGWLTTRKEITEPLSRYHDAAPIARLISQFCDMQGWEQPPEGWHHAIRPF